MGRKWTKVVTTVAVSFASTVFAVSTPLPRAGATTYPINADDATADSTITATSGGTLTLRVLKPTSTPPVGGWPMMIYMTGSTTSRCNDINWFKRTDMASQGYVVVSFNGRGWPAGSLAGACGTSVASQNAEITDELNDNGWDLSGPKDLQDVKDIVTWAIANQPVNSGQIGAVGQSYNGTRTYLLPAFDPRIKAIIPSDAPNTSFLGTVAGISNRQVAELNGGTPTAYMDANAGWFGHSDPSVASNILEAVKDNYLGTAVPTATQTYINDRTFLDDNPSVDKTASLANVPTFIVSGFLDTSVNPTVGIETWKKIPSSNKFLYVGACGHGAQCLTGNATNIRNTVLNFMEKYLRGSAITMGGPVFFAVPPPPLPGTPDNYPDNWTFQQSTTWPPPEPAGAPVTYYLHSGNIMTTTAPTTAEAADSPTNNAWANPIGDGCTSASYGAGEYVQYTTDTAAGPSAKMTEMDADFYVSSTTSRLQLAVDAFEVDAMGTERRIWKGTSIVVPTARNQTPGTHVHFVFKPSGNGNTFTMGNKLRIKVATNYKGMYAQEPYVGTYSIYHTNVEPSKIIMHFAT